MWQIRRYWHFSRSPDPAVVAKQPVALDDKLPSCLAAIRDLYPLSDGRISTSQNFILNFESKIIRL